MPTSTDEGRAPTRINSAVGCRQITEGEGSLLGQKYAEQFNGLPEGVHYRAVFAAFKQAAPHMGISKQVVSRIDFLFDHSWEQDWERGRRPLVWPCAERERQHAGLQATEMKRLTRQMLDFGLVVVRDSPNGKRQGRRDPDGHIIETQAFRRRRPEHLWLFGSAIGHSTELSTLSAPPRPSTGAP